MPVTGPARFALLPWRRAGRMALGSLVLMVVGLLLIGGATPLATFHAPPVWDSAGSASGADLADLGTPPPAPPAVPTPDSGSSIGSVLSTLDLSSNQLYSGSAVLGVQGNVGPEALVYDPVNGDFYIRGNSENDISVVNASSFTDVANILSQVDDQLPSSLDYIPSIVADNQTGYLYATNSEAGNLSVIDPTSETVTRSVPVGGEPHGIAFDWKNHYLYVADTSSANVTVVSAASNSTVKSIAVGTDPASVAFDPVSNQVFVTNFGSANVSVIDPTTNTVTTSVTVGTDPTAIALDTVDGDVDVLDAAGATTSVSTFSAASPPASATTVTVASYAESFAYDPGSDRLFVVGGIGSLTVLDQPSDSVVATLTIGTGSEANAAAYDARNGYVVVTAFDGGPSDAGNVTVIDGTNDRTVANDTTNDLPMGVAVDPGTGEAYVVNYGTSVLETNVTILSESTGLPVASVPLWASPTGLAYDSAQGAIYAVDNAGNDIYEVNTSSEHVVHVETGGPTPSSTSIQDPIVYDGANGDIYTTDEAESAVSVYGPSHTLVTTITVGEEPDALAYDNVSDFLFVGDAYTGKVAIIDTSTNTVLSATLSVKPYDILSAVAYDPHDNDVYVADQDGNNITVWGAENDTEFRSIPVGSTPRSIAFDPENNTLFIANQGSGNISVINDTTNAVVKTIAPLGAYLLAYDGATNAIYNAYYFANEIEALNASTYAPLAGSPLELDEGGGYYVQGLVYDPANGEMYVDDSIGDALNVIGPASSTSYPVEFTETGLPQGTSWSVTLNDVEQSSGSPTIVFSGESGSLTFLVGTVPGYTANVTTGTVDVVNGEVYVYIGFSPVEYGVAFDEVGLPAGTLWNVTLNGVERSSTTSTISFSDPNGSYPFSVGSVTGYVANVTSGTVVVPLSDVIVDIGFSPAKYPVSFVETGLPASTLWNVTLGGVRNSSTTSSIGFHEVAGTYAYSVGAVAGYVVNQSSGNVIVRTSGVVVDIGFLPLSSAYPVTFEETGLPSGTEWSVTFHGATNSSATSSIGFLDANGTWPFSVGAVTGYSASPSSGSVMVQGKAAEQSVTFTATSSLLGVQLAIVPSTVTLGGSVTLTATPSGGVAPYSYRYYDLPSGCASENLSSWDCRPQQTGNFTVVVFVTDAHGNTASAPATLSVKASSSGGSGASSGLSTEELAGALGGVIAAALVIFAFVWWRRRRPPKSSSSTSANPPAPPPS